MIWADWHGGASYAAPEIPRDVETFASIRAARDALDDRARNGGWYRQTFTYADGRTETALTPCARDGASMRVWFYDPREVIDPYPDRLITIGPRGGTRVERT